MIDEIHVANLALIADAAFAPARGMTAVTGETGSGKSAFLSAIKLLVGGRAEAGMVREGAQACVVEGRFFGRESAEDGTVVRRRLSADGRSRVSMDGAMASVAELSAAVGATVELCGQHEHQKLLKQSEHAKVLEAWGGKRLAEAKASYASALGRAEEAVAERKRLSDAKCADAAKVDEARFVLARIDEVAPNADEYEELMAELARQENAEALAQGAYGAHRALSGDGGAIDAIVEAAARLDSLSGVDAALGEAAQALRDATFVLEDVSRDMRDYGDGIAYDPARLVALQERVAALQGLMRSYGPRMEDVMARRSEAAEIIAMVDDSAELLAQADREVERTENDLLAAAEAFSRLRREIAPAFEREVRSQMARLEMGSASLEVSFAPLDRKDWTRSGPEQVEFFFKAAEGMQPRPLARIASGGEVSRVMLAIKVVMGELDDAETIVFDEVDAGVGGATAIALADVLADLARTRQVIVVSHLAQVAVAAESHYVVEKTEGKDGVPETTLRRLVGEDRVKEVARMLSGDTGEAALEHARNMLSA